jgi:restriction system protein
MAETTRRRSGELLRKLFEILKQSPEGMSAAAALEQLANSVQLTEYEGGNYGSGGRRFEKIVRFATVDCVKAGWLVKNKGNWMVTEAGFEAHRRFTDPEAFHKEAARLYYAWRKGREVSEEEIDEPVAERARTTRRGHPASPTSKPRSKHGAKSKRMWPPWTPMSSSVWSPIF